MRVKPHRPHLREEWEEMEGNGRELKVSPLLATRDEARRGRSAPDCGARDVGDTTPSR